MAYTTEDEVFLHNSSTEITKTIPSSTKTELTIFVITIILLTNGYIGNGISLAVLLRKKFRKTSTGVYLIALNITDTICLLFPITEFLLQSPIWISYDIESINNGICMFYNYFNYWIPHTNVWIMVVISVERLAACVSPHR